MKALVYEGPGCLTLTEVPDPLPKPDEVILEVTAAGVCGTDHHLVAGELGVPEGTIPGHETAGKVVACGSDVSGWAEGDAAVGYGQVICGSCAACTGGHANRCTRPQGFGMARPGGFAQYLAIPVASLVPLPTGVDPAVGAIATDAIATPFHALTTVGRVQKGETVAIIGAGGLGLHAVSLARHLGAGNIVVVDPSTEARALAIDFGANEVLDPAEHEQPGRALRKLAGGVDAAFEFVGRASTVEAGLASLNPGGRLVVVGVGHEEPRLPPIIRFIGMELTVTGSFGSTMDDISTVLNLIDAGQIDTSHSVSQRVGLAEAPALFAGPPGQARTVIEPWNCEKGENSD